VCSVKLGDVLLAIGVCVVGLLFLYFVFVEPLRLLYEISRTGYIRGFDALALCIVYALWGFFVGMLIFRYEKRRSQLCEV
jgi:hypothetical protein